MTKKRNAKRIAAAQEDEDVTMDTAAVPTASTLSQDDTAMDIEKSSKSKKQKSSGPTDRLFKVRKRGQKTQAQRQRKAHRLGKALAHGDKRSSKALKLSKAANNRKESKGLWHSSSLK